MSAAGPSQGANGAPLAGSAAAGVGAHHAIAPRTVTLAFTGASGLPYGLRLLECLLAAERCVYLLYSPAAQVVAKHECDLTLPAQPREATRFFRERYGAREGQLTVFGREDWLSPVASGSNPADAMAICPCSMGTLGAIACGLADNLIERAADVMLKEQPSADPRSAGKRRCRRSTSKTC